METFFEVLNGNIIHKRSSVWKITIPIHTKLTFVGFEKMIMIAYSLNANSGRRLIEFRRKSVLGLIYVAWLDFSMKIKIKTIFPIKVLLLDTLKNILEIHRIFCEFLDTIKIFWKFSPYRIFLWFFWTLWKIFWKFWTPYIFLCEFLDTLKNI